MGAGAAIGSMAGSAGSFLSAAAPFVGMGVSLLSSIGESNANKKWGKYQMKQAKADANTAIGASRVEADMIRKAGNQQRSSAVASIADSGVVVGEGSAQEIEKDIIGNAEYDAMITLFDGQDAARRRIAEGQAAKYQAYNKASAASGGMFGSLLGAAGLGLNQVSKWLTPTQNGTPQSSALIHQPTQGFGFIKSGSTK